MAAVREGAYLGGAYLGGATWTQVAAKLEESLQAMNNGGAHWTKGKLSRLLADGSRAYCSIGSVKKHSEGTVRTLTLWILENVTGGDIASFNDHEDTTRLHAAQRVASR